MRVVQTVGAIVLMMGVAQAGGAQTPPSFPYVGANVRFTCGERWRSQPDFNNWHYGNVVLGPYMARILYAGGIYSLVEPTHLNHMDFTIDTVTSTLSGHEGWRWDSTYTWTELSGHYYAPESGHGLTMRFDRHDTRGAFENGTAWERQTTCIGYDENDLDLHFADDPPPTVTQVVPNPDINNDTRVDLVAGRPALLTVKVVAQDAETDDTRPVTVHLIVKGVADPILPWKAADQTMGVSSLGSPGRDIEFLFTPAVAGPQSLRVIVDPGPSGFGSIEESDETNNVREVQVDVKRTTPLTVGYIRVRSPAGTLVGLDSLNNIATLATGFMKAVFPASDVLLDINRNTVNATADPNEAAMAEDVRKVTAALIKTSDRGIGLVADDYFGYHNKAGIRGRTYCMELAALAWTHGWTTQAHEIGHTLDLMCREGEGEEYKVAPDGTLSYAGDPVTGFFVPNPYAPGTLEIKDRICFMGTAPDVERWVAPDHFSQLFSAFLSDPRDPEVLVVTALLWKDGRVDLRPWYSQQEGVASLSREGNYQVRVLDAAGQVLSETGLRVTFKVAEEPVGFVPTDVVPLVLKVPFPPTAATVEIIRDGQAIIETDPLGKLLRDAAAAIPDDAFVANHVEQKKALVNKVEAFDGMVAKGDILPALNKLQNDVRPHVETWLVDDYQKADPLQTTKEELLRLIDNLITRLESRSQRPVL